MFIADNWKDYEVIDTSKGEKLERWGKYILVCFPRFLFTVVIGKAIAFSTFICKVRVIGDDYFHFCCR